MLLRFDSAVESANGLDYRRAALVWDDDANEAREIAERLQAGTIYVNHHGTIAPHIPFRSVKGPGIGVERGIEDLEACTDVKVYNIAK